MLLPLSGPAAKLGQSMQDAAFLALSDKYASMPRAQRDATRVIIIPKDTKGSVTDALTAAQQAINEGAQVLLGPVFGKALETVAPFARNKNVNIISFSNNRLLAGDGVFLMSFLPEQQIERIVEYAAKQNIRSIAALLPNDAYGKTVKDTLMDTAQRNRVAVTKLAFYPRAAQSIKSEILSLFGNPEEEAYEQSGITPDPNKKMTTEHGFQALLIPEGGERLNRIIRDMQSLGIDHRSLMILGSGQWDDDSVKLSPALHGAMFAGTDPDRRQTFVRHFENTYDYQPARLATLAYDAMALVTTLAYNEPMHITSDHLFSRDKLTHSSGFNGPVDGIFRFLPSGLSDRGLAIIEVTPNGLKAREWAPTSFR